MLGVKGTNNSSSMAELHTHKTAMLHLCNYGHGCFDVQAIVPWQSTPCSLEVSPGALRTPLPLGLTFWSGSFPKLVHLGPRFPDQTVCVLDLCLLDYSSPLHLGCLSQARQPLVSSLLDVISAISTQLSCAGGVSSFFCFLPFFFFLHVWGNWERWISLNL